jgi:flagellar protein FlbT
MTAMNRLSRPDGGRLVLELRTGERLLVNGAELQFRSRTTVTLCNRARFLFGRQVMEAAEAVTPARRLYLALQGAYAGEETGRAAWMEEAMRLIRTQMASRSPQGRAVLRAVLAELDADRQREAMQLVRGLFAEDDAAAVAAAD